MDLNKVVKELIEYPTEANWFEFKENWYEPNGIGEYISSLSNVAALEGQEYGYLVWGVNNDTHEITGTKFDYRVDVKNEPLEHFLARQIMPDNNFSFHEIMVEGKRVVVMVVPAASKIPTGFDGNRYLRIGSSKVKMTHDRVEMTYDDRDDAERILEFCMAPRTIHEIMELLGHKERKSTRRYVKPLVEQGRLAMTLPDKPQSKHQKYITIR